MDVVILQLKTNFHGSKEAPDMPVDEPFDCQVVIKGPSVIAGLRQLALAGLADLPMKSHVGKITSLERNKFILQPKSNQNNTTTTGRKTVSHNRDGSFLTSQS